MTYPPHLPDYLRSVGVEPTPDGDCVLASAPDGVLIDRWSEEALGPRPDPAVVLAWDPAPARLAAAKAAAKTRALRWFHQTAAIGVLIGERRFPLDAATATQNLALIQRTAATGGTEVKLYDVNSEPVVFQLATLAAAGLDSPMVVYETARASLRAIYDDHLEQIAGATTVEQANAVLPAY